MAEQKAEQLTDPIALATELTIAWLNNPNVRPSAEDVPALLKSLYATIGELAGSAKPAPAETQPDHVPAVPVRSSIKPDYLVSLIDGTRLKALKRHLSRHGLTPQDYRERYGLKPDYPMVAPNYSAQRRELARKIGLGRTLRNAASPVVAAAPDAEAKPVAARRGRAAKRVGQTR